MSYTRTARMNEDEILSSQSSDEKMDTGSESFRSQDTPSSVLSDFEDKDTPGDHVLRLQNPDNSVLRLSTPDNDILQPVKLLQLNDSLITKMSKLEITTKTIGVSPPKISSTLTLTTDHPLMGLGSPEENYPDLIPKKPQKAEDEKDQSLFSVEDERVHDNASYDFFEPQRNTSKSNLYFSENFLTAESQLFTDSLLDNKSPPDVARVDKGERRKIIPRLETPRKNDVTPPRSLSFKDDDSAMNKFLNAKSRVMYSHSTPKVAVASGIGDPVNETDEFNSEIAEWCESPSQLRPMLNFELPIEMSSNIVPQDDLESPDVVSSSTQGDRSAYQAVLDTHTGNVALLHTHARTHKHAGLHQQQRRRIRIPLDEDNCSSDSASMCSLESDHEPATPRCRPEDAGHSENGDSRVESRRSSDTVSEYSDQIPEYSAAEEMLDERSWLNVPQSEGRHAKCDIKVIEPYKRVVSHGGYDSSRAAVIVFSACYLPDTRRTDYHYVMDNLFLYVIWTLERLVTEEYVLVYLHGSAAKRRLPSFHWLHDCYKLIDRRIRKSLKHLYLVHPTFWLKSFVIITKPFVSSKFFRKLSYVKSLAELSTKVTVDPNAIPELVKQYDESRH